MNRLALWLDNPILVKHARSRLRRMQALPSIAVVMVLGLSAVLLGYQYDGLKGGRTFGALLTLQLVVLGITGAYQVGASVGRARESGILDFHRASPMPPFEEALGFFFGAPIREYLMFAATLPFSLVCVWMGRPSPLGFVQLMASLVLVSWTLHAIALLMVLAVQKGKSGGNQGTVGLVLFLVFGAPWMLPGSTLLPDALDEAPLGHFFEVRLPWLVILTLDLLPLIGFFLVASTRKLASERAHTLSKGQALGALTTGAVLLLGGLWKLEVEFPLTLIVLCALIGLSIFLTMAITPGRDEFVKGIRKAAKEGRKYPSAWSDRGLNRISVFASCGVVLVASTVAWREIERPASWLIRGETLSYSLPIAIGVLVVAYFGLASQFFRLRFGKRGTVYFGLFLFAVWLLPLACGAISGASYQQKRTPGSPPDVWSPAIASLSPIFGILVSGGIGNLTGLREAQAAALLPALSFALLFNNLVTSTRRRVEKETHPEPGAGPLPDPKPSDGPNPGDLAEPMMAT